MYNCIISCLLCFFLAGGVSAEWARDPVSPDEPAVGTAADSEKNGSVPVSIFFAGGGTLDCGLLFPPEYLSIAITTVGERGVRKVPLREIKSIEFSSWRGEAVDVQSFKYCPASITIILKNENRIVSEKQVPELHSFRVMSGKGRKKLFSCFYDYRVKGEWANSREKEMKYPETHPLKGTVVKVLFRQGDVEKGFMNFINIFRE